MAPPIHPLTGKVLGAHGEWLRRLAGHLLHDSPEADDVVQEVWVSALRSPPEEGRPIRPWLAQVVRNAVRSAHRVSSRRRVREEAVVLPAAVETAEDLLARLQLQETIARLMVELEEPYRTTLVLRFHEGQDATTIARRCGVPAGTVRWRISEGIKRLRQRLDEQPESGRRWRALLIPVVGRRRPLVGIAAAASAGLVAIGACVLIGVAAPSHRPPDRRGGSTAEITTTKEGLTMQKNEHRRFAAFVGLALPALMAAAPAHVLEDRRVDLDFRGADIHNILRLLADVAGTNIWTADDVKGEVTIKVKGMPWQQALARICRDVGVQWQRNDNVILVSRAELQPARTYLGARIDPAFSRDGKAVDIREAMAALSAAGHVKIEVADDVQAAVNMKGRDMPWDQVLDVILWTKGLHAERRGEVLRILAGR